VFEIIPKSGMLKPDEVIDIQLIYNPGSQDIDQMAYNSKPEAKK